MSYASARPGRPAGVRVCAALVAAAALGMGSGVARAAVTVYSNEADANFTGAAYPFDSADTNTTAQAGAGTYASLVADDITPAAGYAGRTVTSVIFSAYNGNDASVTAVADLRFYAANGADGGPGTLLYGYNVSPLTFAAGDSALELVNLPAGPTVFALPAGTFWAGLSFADGNGTTGATADQLAGLGQLTYDPPTVGASDDVFFQSDTAGPFTSSNPTGDLSSFGGDPAASFGWQFNVADAAVPEPATAGIAGVVAAAALGRRRRRA